MNCKACHKELILYLEGNLNQVEAQRVKAHLDNCTRCSGFAGILATSLNVIEKEKKIEYNPWFYTRVQARMQKNIPKKRQPVWERLLQPAIFSLLLFAGILGGMKAGQVIAGQSTEEAVSSNAFLLVNEMEAESIENFIMK